MFIFFFSNLSTNQLFAERDTPKGANIVMELWATLEELFVGNFVEVRLTFIFLLLTD